jgi:hypothetical protein
LKRYEKGGERSKVGREEGGRGEGGGERGGQDGESLREVY